jgi:hypothetical protein
MDLSELMGPPAYGYASSAGTAPAANTPTGGLHGLSTPSARSLASAKLLSPENPLFWFGVAVAVTFGAAAFSTSVRVGKAGASLSLGSTT